MTTTIEETALATRTEETGELVPTVSAAAVEQEIKAAITVALRFPRNEDRSFEKLMRSCRRPAFAEDAAYSFPRAGTDITGPSIYLAREAARVWGNIRHGLNVVADDDETRTIEAWAWDLETNTKVFAQDTFKKLIYRKKGGWIKPDERDLRELTNRRGAILKRNCILEIMPTDLIDDARQMAVSTLQKGAAADPEAARKKVINAFSQLNITPEMLEQRLGHKLSECSPAEIAELRQIYKSIADGNSTWAEYSLQGDGGREKGSLSVEDLKPSKEQNRGHGQDGLDRVAPKAEQAKTADAAMAQAKANLQEKAKREGIKKPAERPPDNPNYGVGSDPDPFKQAGMFEREAGSEG
jgi:hypothetical protein